jgi:chaperonin GroEL (HSP60 family)
VASSLKGGKRLNIKQVTDSKEVDQRLAALMTNAGAVQAVVAAVEGTLGPKGLDTMLVDRFGTITVTNDGVTILEEMEATHPAARMLINAARAQEREVGDGTTTATVWAGALVSEGLNQVLRGVPVARVLEGMQVGVKQALACFEQRGRQVQGADDPLLHRVALVSGRGNEEIADLVVQAARLVGAGKLAESGFKLREAVFAAAGADSAVFEGVLVSRGRWHKQMPVRLEAPRVLVIDDALAPEELDDGALATEAGFNRYLALEAEFHSNIAKIIELGVNLILVDRKVDDVAGEMLADAGVLVLARVSAREWQRAAEHTGAWPVKRTALKKTPAELARYLGSARRAFEDEQREQVRIEGGGGKPCATVLVGAATEEVLGERERIAKDAASAVQAALNGGVVPGGGAVELAVGRDLEAVKSGLKGMTAYGVECVAAALKRTFTQIVANAGFNPLEKLGDVVSAQLADGSDCLGIDCDSGTVVNLWERGIIDPLPVKTNALRAAAELAGAIMRIDTIIKKRETDPAPK